jgi:transposase InsO family protein
MGFKEATKMDGRRELARAVLSGAKSMTEACKDSGVSRPTGYRWLRRAEEMGVEEMVELSTRPHHTPRATAPEVVEEILALKAQHRKWGAEKLLGNRWPEHKGMKAPICLRTGDRILAKHGLVQKREKPPKKVGSFEKSECNEMLQVDFKGMGKKPHLYVPFTVIDDRSRFCLAFVPLLNEDWQGVWETLWALFGEYGLPESILSDNGNCFHSVRSRGPSRLEVRLWLLGVRTIHGRGRHPQTQGKVERLHRTLNTETPVPLRQMTLVEAREVLPELVRIYNWERPHKALGLRTPAEVYTPSPRQRPHQLPAHELAQSAIKRKVDAAGLVSYRGQGYRAGRGLVGEHIEIRNDEKGEAMYFAGVRIASLLTLKV